MSVINSNKQEDGKICNRNKIFIPIIISLTGSIGTYITCYKPKLVSKIKETINNESVKTIIDSFLQKFKG